MAKALTGVTRAEVEAQVAMTILNVQMAQHTRHATRAQKAIDDLAAATRAWRNEVDLANAAEAGGERAALAIQQQAEEELQRKRAAVEADIKRDTAAARQEREQMQKARDAAAPSDWSKFGANLLGSLSGNTREKLDEWNQQTQQILAQHRTLEGQAVKKDRDKQAAWEEEHAKAAAERTARARREVVEREEKALRDSVRRIIEAANREDQDVAAMAIGDEFDRRAEEARLRAGREAAAVNESLLPFTDGSMEDVRLQRYTAIYQRLAMEQERIQQDAIDARTMQELEAIDRETKQRLTAEELVQGLQRERLREMADAGDAEAARALKVLEREQRLRERIKAIEEALPGATAADRVALNAELLAARNELAGGVRPPPPDTIAARLRDAAGGAFGANARFLSLGGDRMELIAKNTGKTAKTAEQMLTELRNGGAYGP
jgi:hypothetical protein